MVSEKKIVVAIWLALFGGGVGLHRFYVGKVGTAITMILVSLRIIGLFVTLIWSWIDIIMIASGNFRDKEGNLLKN